MDIFFFLLFFLLPFINVQGKVGFEKLTGLDYRGMAYRTMGNVSLQDCHSRCSEEEECKAAAFSFVVNPLAPVQETSCTLHNETEASNPTVSPQRAVNLYYMVKLDVRSDKVCPRPWTFERVPNKQLRGYDTVQLFTSTKQACLAACLNEKRFVCRSAEYNYATLQCALSEVDRRAAGADTHLADTQGVDYFENLCNQGDEACQGAHTFAVPRFGVPADRVAHHVHLNYWTDKAVIATSAPACRRACEVERSFQCRSFLHKPMAPNADYNCMLYHVDHMSFPDGPGTFHSDTPMPLIDSGDEGGSYFELVCSDGKTTTTAAPTPVRDVSSDPSRGRATPSPTALASESRTTEASAVDDANCDRMGVCYDVAVSCKDTRIAVRVKSSRPFNGRVYALGRSETCNVDVRTKDDFFLDLTMQGQDCNTRSVGGVYTNTIVIQHHTVVLTKADKLYKIRCTYDIGSRNITFGMIQVGDPHTINVTAAPEAPPPKIVILGQNGREAEAVRIGDKLTFRIDIPSDTPYGIFARSCVAMAKDARSTFKMIDDDGCPVDRDIFPHFERAGNALESVYEAFRFTESYGVIFQCNVKYCLGPCEPVNCDGTDRQGGSLRSWGRRKRSDDAPAKDTTLSQEILVLDLDDPGARALTDNARASEGHVYREETASVLESCPTRTSVLALAVTCGLLVLLYVCTVLCLAARRRATIPPSIKPRP